MKFNTVTRHKPLYLQVWHPQIQPTMDDVSILCLKPIAIECADADSADIEV